MAVGAVMRRDAVRDIERIREFLREWDPLGIVSAAAERGGPFDEYDSYASQIMTMLRHECSVEELVSHLTRVQVEFLEVEPVAERDIEVAKRIVEWWNEHKAKS